VVGRAILCAKLIDIVPLESKLLCMTTAYDPHADWAHEDRAISTCALQPVLGPMVYGDACDIRVGRRQCGSELGVREAHDADGRTRIICALHARKLFPNGEQR